MANSITHDITKTGKRRDLGDILVEKGIITPEMLNEALKMTGGDSQKRRRNLPWILHNNFKVDRDLLYQEVANFYAFRTIRHF